MRDYHLVVPANCVAAADPASGDRALGQMRSLLDADTRMSTELDLREIAKDPMQH